MIFKNLLTPNLIIMKKILLVSIVVLTALIFVSSSLNAQNTLEFNRVLIVDNNVQSVPVGTVWKVVSVYGNAPRICAESPKATSSYKYNYFNVQGFIVNGVNVFSEASYAGDFNNSSSYGHYWFNTTNCSGNGQYDNKNTWGLYNINANPNILPMWLPATTTVQAMQGSYLSVIEFNVN